MRGWILNARFFLLLLTPLLLRALVSCNTDKCRYVSCANGGLCHGGSCTCVTGYEGPLCETISTANFIGTRVVWDSGTLYGPVYYQLSIYQAGPSITYMAVDSLYDYYFSTAINAYVSGPDSFVIAPQMFAGKTVQGTGYFYNTQQVVMNYEVIDNASGMVDYRQARWTN